MLISQGADRRDRRRFNEQALDTDRPAHRLAETFLDIANSEAGRLHEQARRHGELNWDIFSDAWFRIVRRVIFGDAARDDEELSVMMAKLRAAANWAFLRPRRPQLRQQLLDRIHHYLSIAEPASLAGVIARTPVTDRTAPEQQVPQWLFAFDAAGMRGSVRRAVEAFLAGVVLEDDGSTSDRFALLLTAAFARGVPSLPAGVSQTCLAASCVVAMQTEALCPALQRQAGARERLRGVAVARRGTLPAGTAGATCA